MRVIEMQELIKLLGVPGDIPSTQAGCTDRLLGFIYPNKDDTQIAAIMENVNPVTRTNELLYLALLLWKT